MVRLRRKTKIDEIDCSLVLGLLFNRMNLNCKVRASEFTHPAPYAVIWPSRKYFFAPQLEHMFGAKRYTDIASFAIACPDDMKEFFLGIRHAFLFIGIFTASRVYYRNIVQKSEHA